MIKATTIIDDPNWEHWPEILRLRKTGVPIKRIAAMYGTTDNFLIRHARRAGIELTEPAKRRTNNKPSPMASADWEGWAGVREMRKKGMSWLKIAVYYNVDEICLRKYSKLMGMETQKRKQPDVMLSPDWEGWKTVIQMRLEGAHWKEIDALYGLCVGATQQKARKAGIELPQVRRGHTPNPMYDPEWEDWEKIRRQKESGITWDKIGEAYGLTGQTMSRIAIAAGYEFARISSNGKVYKKRAEANRPNYSICWECANSVPNPYTGRGCPWSKHFKPVDGWDATETTLYAAKSYCSKSCQKSYCVRSCPLFVRG